MNSKGLTKGDFREMTLNSLDNLIGYWNNVLLHNKFLMSTATLWIVQETLEELKKFKQVIKDL